MLCSLENTWLSSRMDIRNLLRDQLLYKSETKDIKVSRILAVSVNNLEFGKQEIVE